MFSNPGRSIELPYVLANIGRARLRRSHVRTFLNREFDGSFRARTSCAVFFLAHRIPLSPPADNVGISRSHALILMSAVSRKWSVPSGHPMHAGNTMGLIYERIRTCDLVCDGGLVGYPDASVGRVDRRFRNSDRGFRCCSRCRRTSAGNLHIERLRRHDVRNRPHVRGRDRHVVRMELIPVRTYPLWTTVYSEVPPISAYCARAPESLAWTCP
jgi:hypothetical protein